MIFDGRKLAKRLEARLRSSGKLEGKQLLILSSDVGESESIYVQLKQEAGKRLGVKVGVEHFLEAEEFRKRVTELSADREVDGILVQLPLAGMDREETNSILSLIDPQKDVDGLNLASHFWPAVVKAVEKVLRKAGVEKGARVALVGERGMVGRRIKERLRQKGFGVVGFEQGDDLAALVDFGVVISATGKMGLIKPEMLEAGVVTIDLGFPRGDFESVVAQKASFFSPVPGGVGPVTVMSLFENLASV